MPSGLPLQFLNPSLFESLSLIMILSKSYLQNILNCVKSCVTEINSPNSSSGLTMSESESESSHARATPGQSHAQTSHFHALVLAKFEVRLRSVEISRFLHCLCSVLRKQTRFQGVTAAQRTASDAAGLGKSTLSSPEVALPGY